MIKRYKESFNLTIKARQANASPPIGPMLGQRGINIMEFSKEFNSLTKLYHDHLPIPVSIILNKNRTFNLKIKKPLSTFILKSLAHIEKGSSQSKDKVVGSINIRHLYEFINIMTRTNQQQYCKLLIATAKSIGITINK